MVKVLFMGFPKVLGFGHSLPFELLHARILFVLALKVVHKKVITKRWDKTKVSFCTDSMTCLLRQTQCSTSFGPRRIRPKGRNGAFFTISDIIYDDSRQ